MNGQEDLIPTLDVSRETFERLEAYVALLKKWTQRINLVSRQSLLHIWHRHVLDSVQLFRVTEPSGHWVDIGSGGGFPGLVCAILALDSAPSARFTLVESDQRKAAFLRAAAREAGVECDIIACRIEDLEPQRADILTARALADLDRLLHYTERHLDPEGVAMFPKGLGWKKEVDNASRRWKFRFDAITSLTDPEAAILKVQGISRV